MPIDRFFIAPYDQNSGLQTNYKSWLIPDEAFARLNNAYVFRGRVRKRFGSRWTGETSLQSRLRVNLGNTDGSGDINTFTPLNSGSTPIVTPAIGQMFSIGDQLFTVISLGTPADILISGSATSATFDTSTGVGGGNIIITGAAPNAPLYYYPTLPVMGLLTYENKAVNNDPTYAFDTKFAYQYTGGAWERLAGETTSNAAAWSGTDSEFFWGTTWTGANAFDQIFFVTNFNENESNYMRYYTAGSTNQWNNFRPLVTGTVYINSARLIVVFKNRLLLMNTWEGTGAPGDHYNNRVRYSHIGSPLASDAFRQDIPGKGGGIDAPTTESIVTCEFIKDRLIVYFERSTWELVYTGNQAYPFAWQKINTELGVESTFSIVPFDKVAIGIGNVGIHACNGSNVERVDQKIPNTVYSISNPNEGVQRVYGIRDYYTELVYWSFPDGDSSSDFPYPNKVLVYNYVNQSWAINDDSFTCFGYFFQPPQTGITWDSTSITWDDDVTWDSQTAAVQFRQVLAGNQQGFVVIVDANVKTNVHALQITDITSGANNIITVDCINHNLRDGDFVYLIDIIGSGNLELLNNNIFKVVVNAELDTPNQFQFTYDKTEDIIAGDYLGGGLIARISRIDILSKQYNFYQKQGRNAYVSKIDFNVDATASLALNKFDINYYVSTAISPLLEDSAATGTLLGTGQLETFPYATVPFEATASRVTHPVYLQADGEYVQFQIVMNDDDMQLVIPENDTFTGPTFVDFQLNFTILYAQPTSYRLQ